MATKQDYYDAGDDAVHVIHSGYGQGQTFTPSNNYSCIKVRLKLYKLGSPPSDLEIEIFATSSGLPTGTALATGTIGHAGITTDTGGAWYDITFVSSVSLTASTMYAITGFTEGRDGGNNDYYAWRSDDSSPTYSDGTGLTYSSSWSITSGRDYLFETWSPTNYDKTLTDVVSLNELVSKATGKNVSDVVSLNDSLIKLRNLYKTLTDVISLNELVSKATGKNVSDVISLNELVSKDTGKNVSDVVSLNESLIKATGKNVSDVVSLNELVSKDIDRTLIDVISLNDVIGKLRNLYKTLTDVISLNELVSKDTGKNLNESIVLQESLNKDTDMTLTEVIVLNESLIKLRDLYKTLIDVIALNDSLIKGTNKNFAEVVSLNEVLLKDTDKTLIEVVSLNEILSKDIDLTLIDVIALNDSLIKLRDLFMTFTDSVSLNDSVYSIISLALSEMQKDFQKVMLDVPIAEDVTWTRYTEVSDEMGRVASSTNWSQKIKVVIQPIKQKDLNLLPAGSVVSKFVKCYAKHEYLVSASVGFDTLNVGDVLERHNGVKYRVDSVEGIYEGGVTEVYRKCLLRGIGND